VIGPTVDHRVLSDGPSIPKSSQPSRANESHERTLAFVGFKVRLGKAGQSNLRAAALRAHGRIGNSTSTSFAHTTSVVATARRYEKTPCAKELAMAKLLEWSVKILLWLLWNL